jgi:hypothetical protein
MHSYKVERLESRSLAREARDSFRRPRNDPAPLVFAPMPLLDPHVALSSVGNFKARQRLYRLSVEPRGKVLQPPLESGPEVETG